MRPETGSTNVDVAVEAQDRQGLLRDNSEVFAKEKMNVSGVQTQSVKGSAWMTFTVEVTDAARLEADQPWAPTFRAACWMKPRAST